MEESTLGLFLRTFKYWTKLYPHHQSTVLWRLSLPPWLHQAAKGPSRGGWKSLHLVTPKLHQDQEPLAQFALGLQGLVPEFAVSKDPEGNAQPGARERACTDGKEGWAWQTFNALWWQGQLEPRAWWGFGLWADSGGHNDIFQTVSDWPSSWEKDASECTRVYRYNVCL